MSRRRLSLEELQAEALALDKKIKEVTARDKAKREADDRRRQLLAGQAVLHHMATEPQSAFAAKLLGLINERARSAADRALFNLSPLRKGPNGSEEGPPESDLPRGSEELQ